MSLFDGLSRFWPLAVLVPPLAGAYLAYLAPRYGALVGQWISLVNAVAVAAVAWRVAEAGPLTHAVGGWEVPLGIALRVDGLAASMLLASALPGLAASIYAAAYFRGHSTREGEWFWPLWLFLGAALNALFVAADLFNLYITLELLGLAAVGLVSLGRGSGELAAALRYLLVGLTGSLCYLLGVGVLYGAYGGVDLAYLGGAGIDGVVASVALVLMTAGLLFKAGLFPFHFWLPPAHAGAPAPVSAMLSALVVEAAFYLVLRIWLELAPATAAAALLPLLGALGGAAVLWGALNALRAERLKLMVAYSTVAQMGYLFIALPLMGGAAAGAGAWSGAVLLVLAHALAKGAMFLAAGTILHVGGHDRIAALDGTAQRLPVTMAALGLAGVSLIGLPPSGGFLGKWLLLNSAIVAGAWWTVAVLLGGSLLAGAYVFRVVGHSFGHVGGAARNRHVPAALEWPAFALAVAAALLGLAGNGLAALTMVGGPVEGALLRELAP